MYNQLESLVNSIPTSTLTYPTSVIYNDCEYQRVTISTNPLDPNLNVNFYLFKKDAEPTESVNLETLLVEDSNLYDTLCEWHKETIEAEQSQLEVAEVAAAEVVVAPTASTVAVVKKSGRFSINTREFIAALDTVAKFLGNYNFIVAEEGFVIDPAAGCIRLHSVVGFLSIPITITCFGDYNEPVFTNNKDLLFNTIRNTLKLLPQSYPITMDVDYENMATSFTSHNGRYEVAFDFVPNNLVSPRGHADSEPKFVMWLDSRCIKDLSELVNGSMDKFRFYAGKDSIIMLSSSHDIMREAVVFNELLEPLIPEGDLLVSKIALAKILYFSQKYQNCKIYTMDKNFILIKNDEAFFILKDVDIDYNRPMPEYSKIVDVAMFAALGQQLFTVSTKELSGLISRAKLFRSYNNELKGETIREYVDLHSGKIHYGMGWDIRNENYQLAKMCCKKANRKTTAKSYRIAEANVAAKSGNFGVNVTKKYDVFYQDKMGKDNKLRKEWAVMSQEQYEAVLYYFQHNIFPANHKATIEGLVIANSAYQRRYAAQFASWIEANKDKNYVDLLAVFNADESLVRIKKTIDNSQLELEKQSELYATNNSYVTAAVVNFDDSQMRELEKFIEAKDVSEFEQSPNYNQFARYKDALDKANKAKKAKADAAAKLSKANSELEDAMRYLEGEDLNEIKAQLQSFAFIYLTDKETRGWAKKRFAAYKARKKSARAQYKIISCQIEESRKLVYEEAISASIDSNLTAANPLKVNFAVSFVDLHKSAKKVAVYLGSNMISVQYEDNAILQTQVAKTPDSCALTKSYSCQGQNIAPELVHRNKE